MKRLYKGGDSSPLLHPIDAVAWISQGWSETPTEEPHAQKQTERVQRQVKAEQRQVKAEASQETKVAIAQIPPALALINGKDVARDVAIIPTLGQAAAGIILERRPDGGYESLAQVWELCPEVLGGRMKVDPKVVEEWGSEE